MRRSMSYPHIRKGVDAGLPTVVDTDDPGCGRSVERVWMTPPVTVVTVGHIRLTGKRAKRRLLQTFARSQVPNHGAAARATVPRTSRCTVPITSSRS